MSKKGIRISIDGYCHTGKTVLMQAFAAFLEQLGYPAEQITQLNDNRPDCRLKGKEAIEYLRQAFANGLLSEGKIVFTERMVAKLYNIDPAEDHLDWDPMPIIGHGLGLHQATFSLPSNQFHFEMHNEAGRSDSPDVLQVSEADMDRVEASLSEPPPPPAALKSAMERLRLRQGTRLVFTEQLERGDVVNANAALFQHKPLIDMVNDADIRKTGDWKQDEGILNFLEVAQQLGSSFQSSNKTDPLMRFGGINKVMADPELRKQAIAYLQSLHPYDTEYVGDFRSFYSSMIESRSVAKELAFGGAVLGHPLGQNNGDHNGEVETGYKYRMQIHPRTGETREQALVRATPFVKQLHLGGHLAFDYSGIPDDLVFDQKCGIRWYTEQELAVEGKRWATHGEFKSNGVRIMPLEVTRAEIVNAPQMWRTDLGHPDVSSADEQVVDFGGLGELEARRVERGQALDQKLSDAANNLSKISDVSSSGQVKLPGSNE